MKHLLDLKFDTQRQVQCDDRAKALTASDHPLGLHLQVTAVYPLQNHGTLSRAMFRPGSRWRVREMERERKGEGWRDGEREGAKERERVNKLVASVLNTAR